MTEIVESDAASDSKEKYLAIWSLKTRNPRDFCYRSCDQMRLLAVQEKVDVEMVDCEHAPNFELLLIWYVPLSTTFHGRADVYFQRSRYTYHRPPGVSHSLLQVSRENWRNLG